MKIENVKATMVAATAVEIRKEDGERYVEDLRAEKTGLLVVRVDPSSRDDVRAWVNDWTDRPAWRKTPMALAFRKWYRSKTLDQLALLFSLCKVMALHQEGKHDKELIDGYYHGLLELYAPRTRAILPDGREKEVVKTASQMTTIELSGVIEGAFRELSMAGLHMENSNEIKNYYIEWRQWRSKLKTDGLEETYASLDEYRQRVPFCEATLRHLEPGEGHLAHIVSRGAGGECHETWNYLHLSSEIHLGLQHTKGWVDMLEAYPHLIGKVNTARQRLGYDPIAKPEDLYEDMEET